MNKNKMEGVAEIINKSSVNLLMSKWIIKWSFASSWQFFWLIGNLVAVNRCVIWSYDTFSIKTSPIVVVNQIKEGIIVYDSLIGF